MSKMHSIRKWFLTSLAFFIVTLILLCFTVPKRGSYEAYIQLYKKDMGGEDGLMIVPHLYKNFSNGKWRMLSANQKNKLSRLGRILFLDEKPPNLNTSQKNYTILIWNYDRYLKSRPYNMKGSDPFGNCSVKNCYLKGKNSFFWSADAIIFELHTTKNLQVLNKARKPTQIWAFLTDQSPLNTFPSLQRNLVPNHKSLFNWSMTYRMDSDIPIPYGRTVVLNVSEKGFVQKYSQWNKNKKQDVLMAIVSSNCLGKNHRWNYIKKIQKYLKIDIYGKCGDKTCQSDISTATTKFASDCAEISKYKFYLAFENSNCDEYTTEKVWWYGYEKNAIPIVMGAAKASYEQALPPYSYINIENFASPRDLANYVIYLNHTPSDIQDYFAWKKYFKVVNEHGYFNTKSSHYCRICEALHYNSRKKKIYKSWNQFWNLQTCHPSWDSK